MTEKGAEEQVLAMERLRKNQATPRQMLKLANSARTVRPF